MSKTLDCTKYSVLMSVYDKEIPVYFDLSIKSMLAQTVQPEQIVIVEDGPINDELAAIIEKYRTGFRGLFTIVPIPSNLGLANALNEGLLVCRNELVARMDTDDISIPERCEKQLELFKKDPKLTILGSNIDEFIDDPTNIISSRVVPSTEQDILKFARRRNPFNHPTVIYRKSAILKVGGYNVNRRRAQDFELFVNMIHKGYHAENINESLLKFRADENSIARRKTWAHCKDFIEIVHGFWKRGYSTWIDLIAAAGGQLLMCIVPQKVANTIFHIALRETTKV